MWRNKKWQTALELSRTKVNKTDFETKCDNLNKETMIRARRDKIKWINDLTIEAERETSEGKREIITTEALSIKKCNQVGVCPTSCKEGDLLTNDKKRKEW
jgi:outer membrane cobalamin receptor